MYQFTSRPKSTQSSISSSGVWTPLAAGLSAAGLLTGSAAADNTNLHWKAEAAVKGAYDSNVYLQDVAPTNAVPNAVPAKQGSFVTTVSPLVGVDFVPCREFRAGLSYSPDLVWYASAHSEDYMAHRFGANFGGSFKAGCFDEPTLWDTQNTFTYIDGSTEGPTFGRPGDVPAIGGIPLRDRRAAFVYRDTTRLTQIMGKYLIRPVASAYLHDFKTDLRTSPPGGVYENYIDRQDINGGLDGGYEIAKGTRLLMGYRYGRQDQFTGPFGTGGAIINSPYDNTYHRVLVGAEGSPVSWLKFNVMLGPDIREFDKQIKGFNSNELLYYVDAAVTFLPTKKDSITFLNRRYEQPAFSSFSMYDDITYDLTWRHRFADNFSVSAGFRLYIGDWQAPVDREDWIHTPSASVTYAFTPKLVGDLTYSYDWVDSKADVVPGTATEFADGREFTRHMVTLMVRYMF